MAPFVHMVQNPDGQYRTCCMFEKPLEGKYNDIKEAFDSEENQKIRQRMLSGEHLPECEKCDIDESHGGKHYKSYREFFNILFDSQYIKNPIFKTLEISLSNKCNFKCIDCGPRFSDQFGPTIKNNLPKFDNFNNLVHLKLLGGEPFLEKRNFDLLKNIPRKNMTLMLVTNNSIFPNDEILNLIVDFNQLDINISIDGIGEVAEFVRYGTKWSRFEKNWNKWFDWYSSSVDSLGNPVKKRPHVHIIPHFVMHTFTAPFYQETKDWSNIEVNSWSWDFLHNPDWLNLSFLPDHIKTFILKENQEFDEVLKGSLSKFLSSNSYSENTFNKIKNYILKHDVPKKMEEYIDLFF